MNAVGAYRRICEEYREKPAVAHCREYENFYAFRLAPAGSNTDGRVFVGSEFTCVNKTTGKVYRKENGREMERSPHRTVRFQNGGL